MNEQSEEVAVQAWLQGSSVEVNRGSAPAPCVDVTVGGSPALLRASVTALPFRDRSCGTLVARHVLEQGADAIDGLREWRRVADRLVLICPDRRAYKNSTAALDATHEAAFTPDELAWFALHLDLRLKHVGPAVDDWSFLLVMEAIRG